MVWAEKITRGQNGRVVGRQSQYIRSPANMIRFLIIFWEDFRAQIRTSLNSCPRGFELIDEIQKGPEWVKFIEENEVFLDYLTEKTGRKIGMNEAFHLNDAILVQRLYNLSQPEWVTPRVIEHLHRLASTSISFDYGVRAPKLPELIRIRGGPVLGTIIENVNQKVSCMGNPSTGCRWINNLKFYGISAHDGTLYELLTTLGNMEDLLPGRVIDYTASLAVELWRLDGQMAVKILYRRGVGDDFHVVSHLVSGCPGDEFCPLKTFLKRSQPFVTVDRETECKGRVNQ